LVIQLLFNQVLLRILTPQNPVLADLTNPA